MKWLFCFLVLGMTIPMTSTATAADPRPMTLEDLFAFKRVGDPQISPDGQHVVYQVSTVLMEQNRTTTSLHLASINGQVKKQLTNPNGKSDSSPRWSPDGKSIVFVSSRNGSSQLWMIEPFAGGEARQITNISSGASDPVFSPDGKKIAFVSAVYPEFSELPFVESDKKNAAKEKEIADSPVKARTFTKLFFRHWDSYVEGKRQHLFVINTDEKPGEDGMLIPRDVTPGDRDSYPTSSTFSSGKDFTFTPDSQHLVFTTVPETGEAWTTNYDLCRVSITNTSTKWECLTAANKAADSGPQFSRDGSHLAYRAQKQAGYEADKWDILVVKCQPDGTFDGTPVNTTTHQDISVNEFVWQNKNTLVFGADSNGHSYFYSVSAQAESEIKQEPLNYGSVGSKTFSDDGMSSAFTFVALNAPPEVWTTQTRDGKTTEYSVSQANQTLLSTLDLPRPESVTVPVEGADMQMWILKPPGFDASKKWPVVYLVHGGPQGAWNDGWSTRWNPSMWAAQGYVIIMPNPRGSTGFGQKFTDEITGDWGGKCYRDLVAGMEYVEKLPYADPERFSTAGASFGGYMQNWFAVNEIVKKFKCQINHCSVWNFESMWGTTEELWFDEWEHGGLPWEKPGKYAEFSPHKKAGNLAKYKVPMLIIHNDYDFRCPIGQGHELFTALQRQGVPSKFVNFPDEGHWVLKPKNSEYWHKEVFAWLNKYTPPGGK